MAEAARNQASLPFLMHELDGACADARMEKGAFWGRLTAANPAYV